MFVLLSLLTVGLFSASDVSAASTDNQSSYQTAFLYFLPDYKPKEQNEAEVRGCRKIGYTFTRSNCAAPRILKDKCPIGNVFKTCYCAGSPTCTGSASSANPYPTSTGASMTSCVDCPGNTHYNWTCSSSACSAYTLSSCPANGYCSRCCSGKYKLDYCSSAYVVSGNFCVCATTCSDAVTSKPDNSSYTTTSCTACGITTTIKSGWSCNSGYVKSGSSCICAKTCTDAVTSKPANSSYTTTSCTACGITTTIKSGWSCNSGYVKSGSSCICAKTCTDAVTSKPANSSYTTSSCTACGITTTIKSGWSCNSGYTKSGSFCEPSDPSKICTTATTLKYLYSDRTVSTELISSKTVIGIVVDELNRLAAAIEHKSLEWGGNKIDIPALTNIASAYEGTWEGINGRCYWWGKDQNGQQNTQTILAYGRSKGISYPAAEYANSYHPSACASGSWCGAGKWFLPSNYEIYPIYNNVNGFKNIVMSAGGANPDIYQNGDLWHKTSNEFTATINGYMYINSGMAGMDTKAMESFVRPFIKY